MFDFMQRGSRNGVFQYIGYINGELFTGLLNFFNSDKERLH